MKQFVLIFFTLIVSHTILCQEIQSLNDYKDYKSLGETKNGIKVGEWIDLSIDSIIYRKGSYNDAGIPVGTWSVFFPNGDIRKSTTYDIGEVIKWTCYSDNEKIIEISSPESIDINTYKEILIKETKAMELNDNPFEYSTKGQNELGYSYSETYILYYNHLEILYYQVIRLLRYLNFSGSVTKWDSQKRVERTHDFIEGNDNEKQYIFKRGRLQHVKEFRNGTLLKVITYNKKGEIKMVTEK